MIDKKLVDVHYCASNADGEYYPEHIIALIDSHKQIKVMDAKNSNPSQPTVNRDAQDSMIGTCPPLHANANDSPRDISREPKAIMISVDNLVECGDYDTFMNFVTLCSNADNANTPPSSSTNHPSSRYYTTK